jgi:hypothetical protein
MNVSRAKVRAGESLASFEVRLPRWNSDSTIENKCSAKLVSLAGSVPEPKKARVTVHAKMDRSEKRYAFRLMAPYSEGTLTKPDHKSVEKIGELMANHFDSVARAFPLVEHDMLFWHDSSDPRKQLMRLNLPPYSGFYTTYEYWWPSLRFMDYKTKERVIGGRGAGNFQVTTKVYGYWNETEDPVVIVSDDVLPANTSMRVLLTALFEDAPVAPGSVQFQAEVDSWPEQEFVSDGEVEMTVEGVTEAFDKVFEDVRKKMNLAYRPLLTHISSEGTLSLTNFVVERRADYFSTFTVRFGTELASDLGLPDTPLKFQMDLVKHLPLTGVKRKLSDPFEGRYPVIMVCRNVGEAVSYVEGLDFVPILGLLKGATTPPTPFPMVFSTDRQWANFEFFDKAMSKVVFVDDVELHLLLEFTPVSLYRPLTIEDQILLRSSRAIQEEQARREGRDRPGTGWR